MPTPAEFGRLGGAKSKFERAKSGTDMDIASGKQRTLGASWSGLTLSSSKAVKEIAAASNQLAGPVSIVAKSRSKVNFTINAAPSPPPTPPPTPPPPGTTPPGTKPPSPSPQLHTEHAPVDVDDVEGFAEDVEEVVTKKNSDVGEKSQRPEKRLRSQADDESNINSARTLKMLERQEEVSKIYHMDSYGDHVKKINQEIDEARRNKNQVVVTALEDFRSKLPKIWAKTCPALAVDVIEEPDSAADSDSTADEKPIGSKKPPNKKPRYTTAERRLCVAERAKHQKAKDALNVIHTWRGFKGVSASSLREWCKPGGCEDRTGQGVGRKTVAGPDFDVAVLSKLIVTKIDPETSTMSVKANVASSYDIVRTAAMEVRTQDKWKNNIGVQNLQFEDTWVIRWMRDMGLTRLRVTSESKTNLPSVEEVRQHMKTIQKKIDEGGYSDDDVFNPDETATRPGASPLYQLQFPNMRGAAINPNSMLRFTTMLAGSAAGNMLPSFNIIKCTIRQTTKTVSTASSSRGRKVSNFGDLSSSTILDSLQNKAGFRNRDGWTKGSWTSTLSLKVNGENSPSLRKYVRPYLIHSVTGTVITIHNQAWMDSVGLCMWAELVVKPWAKGKKKLMVWDNCPSHCVPEVIAVFKKINVEVDFLPKNMTDKLQPMDLAVNAALKARMRKLRGEHLYQQVQKYNESRTSADFIPSPPTITDGLNMVMDATSGLFQEEKFKKNLSNTFYKVGLAKQDGGYINYTGLDVITTNQASILEQLLNDVALDHTVARYEGEEEVATFDQEEEEVGQEKGDEVDNTWCNEANEANADGSISI
jgi:hypothetical protein